MNKILLIAILSVFLLACDASAKKLCVTVDFKDNVWKSFMSTGGKRDKGIHTTENIDQMMQLFADNGFREVFWIYNVNDYKTIRVTDSKSGGEVTYDIFLKYLVKSAHNHKLKIFMIYKTFETGHTFLPHPYFREFNTSGIQSLNGYFNRLDDFIMNHPEMRLKRHPYDTSMDAKPVTSIKLISKKAVKTNITPDDLAIYTSNVNGDFKRYSGTYDIKSGFSDVKGKRYFIVTLDKLNIAPDKKYIWIEYKGKSYKKNFYNLEDKLMELYSEDKLLPATNSVSRISKSTIYSRRNNLRIFNTAPQEQKKAWAFKVPKNYGKDGNTAFIFGQGPGKSTIYFDSKPGVKHGYIAAYRGKEKYLNGLNPAYPEVREYWLRHVKKLTELDVDGIDIRTDCHSTWNKEGEKYGFNKPAVDEFKSRYGVDVLTQKFDIKKWRALNDEYYLKFLTRASEITRASKVKLFVHISYLMERYFPRKLNNLPENYAWNWRKWINNNLVDGVTLKYIPFPWGNKSNSGKDLVQIIGSYVHKQHKEVYLNVRIECWYLELLESQRKSFPLKPGIVDKLRKSIKWAWSQKGVDAINLYEANDFMVLDPNTGKLSFSKDLSKMLKELN